MAYEWTVTGVELYWNVSPDENLSDVASYESARYAEASGGAVVDYTVEASDVDSSVSGASGVWTTY